MIEQQKQQLQQEGLKNLLQQQNQPPPLLPELSEHRSPFNQPSGFNQPVGLNKTPAPGLNQSLNQGAEAQQQLSSIIQVLKNQIVNTTVNGVANSANLIKVPHGHSNSNSGDEGRETSLEKGSMDQHNSGRRERKSRFSDLKQDEWGSGVVNTNLIWDKEEESNHSIYSTKGSENDGFSPNTKNINTDYTLPPPHMPDMSRPPPGFDSEQELPLEDLVPELPYFELPAGVMVPLIRLEDFNYRPINPDLIRIPAPTQPSERLIQAIEAFYSMPSHERPRDGEGWEKLALYEYFKVKNSARKQKEDEISQGLREKSPSPTPIATKLLKPMRKKSKRVYRSKSRSKSRSRSKSKTPVRISRQRSSSPRNRSRSPRKQNRRNSGSRSSTPPSLRRDRRERECSISPPSFAGATYTKSTSEYIEESNKGNKFSMKMGWQDTGMGLGNTQREINSPISGGEVRERQEKFKGVGEIGEGDPFESFRRNKSNSFIHRIRSKDERP